MSWNLLAERQDKVVKIILNSYQKERLSHAYLLEGAKGTGKKEVAIEMAKMHLCQHKSGANPCDECIDCKRIVSQNHPDVHFIEPSGSTIKVEQIRDLKKEFSKKGMESSKKVYIVSDVEKMTASAANSLLKFLEEPEAGTLAILLSTAPQMILNTILSRVQSISFSNLAPTQLIEDLVSKGISPAIAKTVVKLTNDLDAALTLSTDEWIAQARLIVIQLVEELYMRPHHVFFTIQDSWLTHFKEREQLQIGLDLLLMCYQDLLRTLLEDEDSLIFIDHQDKLQTIAMRTSGQSIGNHLTNILEAKRRLSSNVHPQLLMEQLVLRLREG